MKTYSYDFADGYGCFWYNKPMGKREMARKVKEHGPLVRYEQIK